MVSVLEMVWWRVEGCVVGDVQAVKEDYYFQMFYDDLPIWGFVGKFEKVERPPPAATENRYYLFTHGGPLPCALIHVNVISDITISTSDRV